MLRLPTLNQQWRRLSVAAAVFFMLTMANALGQVVATPAPAPVVPRTTEENEHSHAALTALGESFKQLDGDLKTARDQLKAKLSEDEKKQTETRIRELGVKREELLKNLEFVITGFDLQSNTPAIGEVINLQTETRDLLLPIVQALKQMTASPREVEGLRTQVSTLRQRRILAAVAVQRLETQMKQETDTTLKPLMQELLKNWKQRQNDSATELAVAEFKLQELEVKRGGMFGALKDVTSGFFKQRGRNLLLAVCVSLITFGSLRLLWRRLQMLPQFRRKNRSFALRLVVAAFHVCTLVLVAFSALLVFYIAGDWVLLGLATLFLIGIAWAGKRALPVVYEQLKILLNLGSVREGERVIYNGLPWEVRRIGMFSELHNPAFDCGEMRLPLRDLTALISRPTENELWFPCAVDDWVCLKDGTHGKVLTQSPEWVQLILLGGSRRTYPTRMFLDLCPENLAKSFRVRNVFGIDYCHQALCTTEIPAKLKECLERELRSMAGGDHLKNVSVDLKEAASSSLNFSILADFSGEVAQRHGALTSAIQRICVDACNEYGWTIPFTQLVVHQAAPAAK